MPKNPESQTQTIKNSQADEQDEQSPQTSPNKWEKVLQDSDFKAPQPKENQTDALQEKNDITTDSMDKTSLNDVENNNANVLPHVLEEELQNIKAALQQANEQIVALEKTVQYKNAAIQNETRRMTQERQSVS